MLIVIGTFLRPCLEWSIRWTDAEKTFVLDDSTIAKIPESKWPNPCKPSAWFSLAPHSHIWIHSIRHLRVPGVPAAYHGDQELFCWFPMVTFTHEFSSFMGPAVNAWTSTSQARVCSFQVLCADDDDPSVEEIWTSGVVRTSGDETDTGKLWGVCPVGETLFFIPALPLVACPCQCCE